jgi:hypothetical protein
LRKLSIEDVANFAFLNTLLLFIVYSENDTGLAGVDYAEKTIRYNSFDHYRISGSDLYIAYYILFNTAGDELIGGTPEGNALARSRINVPMYMLRKMFKEMANDSLRIDSAFIQRFFLMLEKKLNIKTSNYKSIRRLVQNWHKASTPEKQLVVTRMSMYFRTNARLAELFPYLEMLARKKNWNIDNANNPETKSGMKKIATGALRLAGAATAGYYLGKQIGKLAK